MPVLEFMTDWCNPIGAYITGGKKLDRSRSDNDLYCIGQKLIPSEIFLLVGVTQARRYLASLDLATCFKPPPFNLLLLSLTSPSLASDM